jgi:hypothetical protein
MKKPSSKLRKQTGRTLAKAAKKAQRKRGRRSI